jgi:hypothetical protein
LVAERKIDIHGEPGVGGDESAAYVIPNDTGDVFSSF